MGFYDGKRVYVTGGSSGIGKAIAIEAARRGASVWISARTADKLAAALVEVKAAGRSGRTFGSSVADVSLQEQAEGAAKAALAGLGGLDVLVNNAGISVVDQPEKLGPDAYRRLMDTNYFGTVWTTLTLLPHFRQQRSGTVSAVSSLLGLMGLYGYAPYAASKFAVTGMFDSMRQDLLKYNVKVAVLFPPDTDTPQLQEENRHKPEKTKIIAGTAGLLSSREVARSFLDGVAKGDYAIVPGLQGKFVAWSAQKIPWAVRWVIDRDLRKFWKRGGGLSQAPA